MNQLIRIDNAKSIYNKKRSLFVEKKIPLGEEEQALSEGYEVVKRLKNELIVKKEKKHNVAFEDEIWCLFYEMGFVELNDGQYNLKYGDENENFTKQIDVLAMDEETIILVECKSAEKLKPGNFKQNIESYNGMREGFIRTLRKSYPGKKVAMIYATRNLEVGVSDKERLDKFKIVHFDEKVVQYFKDLASHLGKASKYQLLGVLFPNTKVEGLETKVVAIRGEMGNKTYYSFSIEPEKLLKLSFILHRSNSLHTDDLMPTYQRIIKKNRLKDVKNFVNSRGFFPNSIIVSVNNNGNNLKFEPFSKDELNGQVKAGFLHLPALYRTCYVIDGQHRLYGYSESEYAKMDVIPVIAFVNMAKEEQVKMFMDINQNQKAVSKSLRNTLDIDLLWDSPNKKEKNRALILGIIQNLGEKNKSWPFYDKILTGENTKTLHRVLTLENLRLALSRTIFINEYDKNNSLVRLGLLDTENNSETRDKVTEIINYYFSTLLKNFEIKELWDLGEKGLILTNNMVSALLMLLSDVIEFWPDEKITKVTKLENIKSIINDLSDILSIILTNLSDADKKEIRSAKGGSAPLDVKKLMGYKVSLEWEKFKPNWLQEYIDGQRQENAKEAMRILSEFLNYSKKDFYTLLEMEFGSEWTTKGINGSTSDQIALIKNRTLRIDPNFQYENDLDFASFRQLYEISGYGSNWSKLFKSRYQDENKLLGDINPLNKLDKYFNKVEREENLSKADFENIKKLINEIYDRTKSS